MIHDPDILDRLSAFEPIRYDGEVFRATRKSLDPLAPSISGGRWAPKEGAAVLYTSAERDGALAETTFHLSQFSPLPSKPIALHRIGLTTRTTLRLLRADLIDLGVDWDRYNETDYARTREIGAAISFLECDGLFAPSARWSCENLILFMDNHTRDYRLEALNTEEVDWIEWARTNKLLLEQPITG